MRFDSTLDLVQDNSETTTINLVVLDDNEADLAYIHAELSGVCESNYVIHGFQKVDDAVHFICDANNQIDCCLVDYSLVGETALDFVSRLKNLISVLPPILVMTGTYDRNIDERLMYAGVQDFRDKSELNANVLERSIRYAIYRYHHYCKKCSESEGKTQHLAHICHELKNPLNAIMGFSRYACQRWDAVDTDEQRKRIEESFSGVFSNCKQLRALTNELLNVSEIETGKVKLTLKEINLFSFLKEVIADHQSNAESRGLSLNVNSAEDLRVCADKIRLKQIISNLISNAIKYSDEGGIDVAANRFEDQGKMFVKISVIDTGIGIDRKELENVFSEYVTVHNRHSRNVDSTGLGLAIVKKLVELHNGKVWVESQLGVGSTFTVLLPQSRELIRD